MVLLGSYFFYLAFVFELGGVLGVGWRVAQKDQSGS